MRFCGDNWTVLDRVVCHGKFMFGPRFEGEHDGTTNHRVANEFKM